jgi:D-alanyl-D-alanine carboxypeptidase (penicillin-binding protein 5/6)
MKKTKAERRWLCAVMALMMVISLGVCLCPLVAADESVPMAENGEDVSLNLSCKSAVLMEASTGRVLYEQNPDEALPPASVTKIMTLLLVMEAIDDGKLSWDDKVSVSAHAASMGGSQVYLEEGEEMSARDMIKSVVIASANDAAVALAERVAGSEEAFVKQMNKRAAELGMENTKFENTNGLDDTAVDHVTSAEDIAIMSRALISHKEILEYSSIWMDTIRDGAFGLTNTNRLVRFYRGCNGLKTGSTAKAGFCVSVTAERDGMTLICVIMGAESRDARNAAATKLLDWGFANYGLYTLEGGSAGEIRVTGGEKSYIDTQYPTFSCVLPRGDVASVESKVELADRVAAPIRSGEAVGKVTLTCRGEEIGSVNITAGETSERISYGGVLWRMLGRFLMI